MSAIADYFRGAVQELHQVRWPTRQQAIRLSIIVILFVAACTVVFGAVDFGLSRVVKFLLALT